MNNKHDLYVTEVFDYLSGMFKTMCDDQPFDPKFMVMTRPTGSRLFNNASAESDYDVLVYVPDLSYLRIYIDGTKWNQCGDPDYSSMGKWAIYRSNDDRNINIICTSDQNKYDTWKRCHDLVMYLGASDKNVIRMIYKIMVD